MASVIIPTTTTLKSQAQSKVALVTGAASGKGFAITRLLEKHDAKVVLIDLDLTKVHAAAEEIGHGSTPFSCDVSLWTQQMELFECVSQ
ncbi:uncharacterized protein Z519_05678 [Cladophialophora bantiana CBS 173.52]|uniref:Uncharacterized protein n=1 Tax=Cladophialophora bantiana (strain ATCC 10958 / CBS 173.52 / CDC B-1940 / NIH 8579) TaxID=1442370 RepID=A0A0D2HIH8_CLAB1|nr:uncharacterized protein Z519_05678 [Cladophialophora bantiana CBS 173.52]KIW93073.1 hypothetical protein Z519_05678 [Cladophialophora bantiana CBS 173.52]